MNKRTLWLAAILIPLGLTLATLALYAPQDVAAPINAVSEAQDLSHRYSPFVVKVSGESSPFETITFKDVGIADVSNNRSIELYELVAESLRYELDSDPERNLSSQVFYDEAAADPANHHACAGKHIYVDIWRTPGSERWGYSLWSGCGEEDNFAWREVSVSPELAESDSVDQLTAQIGRDLREAISTGCFTKAC